MDKVILTKQGSLRLAVLLLAGIVCQFIDLPAKLLASELVARLLQPFFVLSQQGTLLSFTGLQLEINDGCSGLNTLMVLLVIAGLLSLKTQGSLTKLLILAIPCAIVTNVLRIIMIVLLALVWGVEAAMGIAHDIAAYASLLMGCYLFISLSKLKPLKYPSALMVVALLNVLLLPQWFWLLGALYSSPIDNHKLIVLLITLVLSIFSLKWRTPNYQFRNQYTVLLLILCIGVVGVLLGSNIVKAVFSVFMFGLLLQALGCKKTIVNTASVVLILCIPTVTFHWANTMLLLEPGAKVYPQLQKISMIDHTVPYSLEQYQAQQVITSQQELRQYPAAKLNKYLYSSAGHQASIIILEENSQQRYLHPPLYCYLNAGWKIRQTYTKNLQRYYRLSRGIDQLLVTYWFETKDKKVIAYSDYLFHKILSKLGGNSVPWRLLRVDSKAASSPDALANFVKLIQQHRYAN